MAVPGAPVGVRSLAFDRSAKVFWKVPLTDGGETITGYEASRSLVEGAWTIVSSVTEDAGATDREHEFSSLLDLIPVYFRVRAKNSDGKGAWSEVVSSIPGAGLRSSQGYWNGRSCQLWMQKPDKYHQLSDFLEDFAFVPVTRWVPLPGYNRFFQEQVSMRGEQSIVMQGTELATGIYDGLDSAEVNNDVQFMFIWGTDSSEPSIGDDVLYLPASNGMARLVANVSDLMRVGSTYYRSPAPTDRDLELYGLLARPYGPISADTTYATTLPTVGAGLPGTRWRLVAWADGGGASEVLTVEAIFGDTGSVAATVDIVPSQKKFAIGSFGMVMPAGLSVALKLRVTRQSGTWGDTNLGAALIEFKGG